MVILPLPDNVSVVISGELMPLVAGPFGLPLVSSSSGLLAVGLDCCCNSADAPCPDGYTYNTCTVSLASGSADCACWNGVADGPFGGGGDDCASNASSWIAGDVGGIQICPVSAVIVLCCGANGRWHCHITTAGGGEGVLVSYTAGVSIVFDCTGMADTPCTFRVTFTP